MGKGKKSPSLLSVFEKAPETYYSAGPERKLAQAIGVAQKPQEQPNYLKFKSKEEYEQYKKKSK